jgi:hypothetical protein
LYRRRAGEILEIVGSRTFAISAFAAIVFFSSCRTARNAPLQVDQGVAESLPPPPPVPPASSQAHPEPASSLAEWVRKRLPAGGAVQSGGAGSIAVTHTVAEGDTALTIAKAYLDLTSVYRATDLAAEITKSAPNLRPGTEVNIPHVLSAPYRTPDEERLRWPEDRVLKGIFISGIFAGSFWPETIEKLAARRLNAVVLDAKDYMGTVNYPTHVKLALEIEAAKDPPIPDYFRAIRFAHARGIRVIARIPCFHDPWAAKHAPRLSLMGIGGRPFEMGWTDPGNDETQQYVVDLVREAVELGADEVQLDYVRFPVYSPGIKNAAMPPPDGHRSQAIKAFIRRVHEVTQERQVPLSLDLFGVTATGTLSDIEALGQNIGVIGGDAEALSPMVYPSHYADGWNGFDNPGDHPEIIGIGTKAAIEKLKSAHITSTIMRPWLQAAAYKSPTFGPKYIQDEIRSAEAAGALGWLMWDPGNNYWAVWKGVPVVSDAEKVATAP